MLESMLRVPIDGKFKVISALVGITIDLKYLYKK